jgi:hypothetical protein
MDNENIKAVVDNAFTDNAVEMRNALYNAINDKIFSAIEAKKQHIAQNLVNSYEDSQTEEQTETEE